jgi:hypothetical protein
MFEQSNLMIEKLTASQAVVLALVLLAFVALATMLLDRWCNSRS